MLKKFYKNFYKNYFIFLIIVFLIIVFLIYYFILSEYITLINSIMDRRSFLALTGTMPFLGFENFINELSNFSALDRSKITSLRKDPNKIIDLHRSLKYNLISKNGSRMTDGFKVPHLADGMGAFNVNGDIVLVRNLSLIHI